MPGHGPARPPLRVAGGEGDATRPLSQMGVFKRAFVGSLSINNHPYILTLEPFNEKP